MTHETALLYLLKRAVPPAFSMPNQSFLVFFGLSKHRKSAVEDVAAVRRQGTEQPDLQRTSKTLRRKSWKQELVSDV